MQDQRRNAKKDQRRTEGRRKEVGLAGAAEWEGRAWSQPSEKKREKQRELQRDGKSRRGKEREERRLDLFSPGFVFVAQ